MELTDPAHPQPPRGGFLLPRIRPRRFAGAELTALVGGSAAGGSTRKTPMDQTDFIAAIERLGGEAYVPGILTAAERWGIDTPLRQAHWLAQMAHESGGFCFLRETWGPTKAQRGYEGRADLGNTQPGDGFRFRGRGFIQITGRENYTLCSLALHGDERLVHHPELLEHDPATGAGWYWHARGINRFADRDDVRKVTRAVNGGYTGLDDRIRRLDIAKQAMEAAFRSAVIAKH